MLAMKKLIFIACLVLYCVAASAEPVAAAQDHAQIKKIAADFVQQQSATLSGKVTYKIGDIDQRITMPACPEMEAFLPAGSRFIGNASIGVRCTKKNGWSIFVPVQIKLSLNLLVSARQLPSGHALQEQDLVSQTIEVSTDRRVPTPSRQSEKCCATASLQDRYCAKACYGSHLV